MVYSVADPCDTAVATGSPAVNGHTIIPAAEDPVAGVNKEEGNNPFCHKTQMVLLLDSQK